MSRVRNGPRRRLAGRRRRGARPGFTLLELVVALGVGALALLAARSALVQIAGAADVALAAARVVDREANAERLLRATVGQLETGVQPARAFAGDARAATFATWCDTPSNQHVPCRARLASDSADGRPVLTLTLTVAGRPDTVVLRRATRSVTLRYLTTPEAGGRWVPSWPPAITPPLALGVISDADTLILRIGARG
ncbi:MAG TPA: prepilin-type N-terminal cleavage/methylation domain-containing protein [Gemmatirosa sp.]